jgi:probable phosphoglycerate mutase
MVGRRPGVRLGPDAPAWLDWLQQRFAEVRVDSVVASPLERAQATAAAIAKARGLEVETDPDLDEIDCGDWTGKAMAELDGDPDWTIWNTVRAQAKAPHGESLAEVQARMARATERLIRERDGTCVVAVSHGDPIKLALCWRLGWGVDRIDHFDIAPASISALSISDRGAMLRFLNERPD